MTHALRSEGILTIDELVELNRQSSYVPLDLSSTGTPTSTLYTSTKPSTNTKPTSAGTSYRVDNHLGKGTTNVNYASSLSATHGSESDSELDASRDTLLGVGGWAGAESGEVQLLKGPAKARRRPRPIRRLKEKKPPVVVHQEAVDSASDEDEDVPAMIQVTGRNGKGMDVHHRPMLIPDREQKQSIIASRESRPSQSLSR